MFRCASGCARCRLDRERDPVSPATIPTDERFPCFNGLRATAALLVVLHHTAFTTAFDQRGLRIPFTQHVWDVGPYFLHMDIGVEIFFLISGFLLYRPMVAAAFADRSPRDVRTYARHRFLRIYPAYWVAFVCIALFVGVYMPVAGGRSLLSYFFLVHLYDPGYVMVGTTRVWRALGGISQSWTLVVEVSFYIFLPLYAALMRRIGAGRDRESRFRLELAMLVVLYGVSVAWRAAVYWAVPGNSAFAFLGNFWLPANLDLFALGMGLAVVRTWSEARGEPVPLLERIGRLDWLWWLLAAFTFHAVTFWIGLPDNLTLVLGGKAFLRELLYSLAAFLLLLPAVFGPQDRGITRRFLQLRPMVYLGMISYGIYLWHQAFIEKVHRWGGWADNPLPNGPFLATLIPALALTIVVATLSWYLVEAPLLRRKDRPLFGRAPERAGSAT
jgi:peptidoglycan/LPS O-acetylase OafA/YrhL